MAKTQKRRRSSIESFGGCPYRYDQTTNKGVIDKGDESIRGVTFHEAALQYIRRLAAKHLASDADEAQAALIDGLALSNLPHHLLSEVSKIWGRFAEWFQLDLDAYLSSEELQETDRFTWIPDLVYLRPMGPEIIDWKTYFKGLTRQQALKEFQLKFYLLMALKLWPGFPTYTFTFNFVRLGYEVRITLTPDEIEKFSPEVEGALAALEEAERTGQYPAIPGSHCTLCRLACPLVDNPARMPIRVGTKTEAESMAGQILVLQQKLKTYSKALQGWVGAEGPLVVNGQQFLFRESEVRKFQAVKVLDVLGKVYGDDNDQAQKLMVGPTAIREADPLKAVKDHPDLGEPVTSPRWSFVHQKAGELFAADTQDDDDADD